MINKKIVFIVFLSIPLVADLSIEEMHKMVEKIKAKRASVVKQRAEEFVSPFVLIQQDKNTTVAKQPKNSAVEFVLDGLINNKAFLNNRWVKNGDMVGGYKVIDIDDTSVTLMHGKFKRKIIFKKRKSILQFNKG